MNYIGDFAEDKTIYLSFNTFTSDDPSASCTVTNLLNTDIHIHRDSGLTQRNNAAGVVVSVDFDGITGNHIIAIDTSDDTVANFWITGHDYFVRAEGISVDGATINAFVGHFSIENRYERGTDSAYTGTPPTVGDIRTEMEVAGSKISLTLADTDELQTDWKNTGRLDNILDGRAPASTALSDATWTNAKADFLNAAITSRSSHSAADVWAVAARILTANTNFNDLDAAAIKAEVVAALADIKLDHLLNIAVDTDWGTTVHLDSVIGHLADVGTAATFDRTQESMEAIRARGDAAWITAIPPTVAQIRAEMEDTGYFLDLIKSDTDELQTDWANGGRLDLIIDEILNDTGTTLDDLIKNHDQNIKALLFSELV